MRKNPFTHKMLLMRIFTFVKGNFAGYFNNSKHTIMQQAIIVLSIRKTRNTLALVELLTRALLLIYTNISPYIIIDLA